MPCGMPVFRCDFDDEGEAEEVVDDGDDGAAGGHGKGAVLRQVVVSILCS